MINIPNYGILQNKFNENHINYVETQIKEPIKENSQNAKVKKYDKWYSMEDELNTLSNQGMMRKQNIEPSQNMYTDLMMGVNHRNINR